MAKKNQQEIQNVDKRVVDRLVARGEFSRSDQEDALNKLPDLEDQAENIAARIYGDGTSTGE